MTCAVHTDVEATGFCRNCGKALCAGCVREVKGALYCEDCLAAMVAPPVFGAPSPALPLPLPPPSPLPLPPARPAGEPNPALACFLGFIPGLGAVYNGEYMKALLQVLIFGALIAALSNNMSATADAVFGIALGVMYFYMPVDSYRVAQARRAGQPAAGMFSEGHSSRVAGPAILIILGILFLLGNMGLLRADWIGDAWPVGLVALGGWLLWKRMQG